MNKQYKPESQRIDEQIKTIIENLPIMGRNEDGSNYHRVISRVIGLVSQVTTNRIKKSYTNEYKLYNRVQGRLVALLRPYLERCNLKERDRYNEQTKQAILQELAK